MALLMRSRDASRRGGSQHQGDGSAALQGLGVQGTGKGWGHFGEEVMSGDVVQGTCSLPLSCNEQLGPLLAFSQSEKESARTVNQKAT